MRDLRLPSAAIVIAFLLAGSAMGVAGQDEDASPDDGAPELMPPGPLGKSLADWNLEHLRWAPDAEDCSSGDRGEVFFLPRRPLTRADCRIGADQHVLLAIGAIGCSSDDSLVERWQDARGDKKRRADLERRILEDRSEAHTCLFGTRPDILPRGGPSSSDEAGVIGPTLIVDDVEVAIDERYLSVSTPAVLEGFAYQGGRPALVVESAYMVMLEPLPPGTHVIEYGATYLVHGGETFPATSVVFAEVVEGTADAVGPSPSPLATATTADWMLIEPASSDVRSVRFEAVAALPSGEVVAIGNSERRGHAGSKAFAWHTSDPTAWTEISLPGRKDTRAVDVVATDDGLVGIGNRLAIRGPNQVQRQILVWRSRDGRAWNRPLRIQAAQAAELLVTDEGLALLGATVEDPRRPAPTLWRSSDGKTFEATPIAGPGSSAGHVARSPAGTWIVVGERMDPDGRRAGNVLWRSQDGRTWDDIALPFADPRRDIRIVGAGWTPSGFILAVNGAFLGADGPEGSIWHSPGGTAWDRVATSGVPFGVVATGEHGQFVFASGDLGGDADESSTAPLIVLSSSDGRTWQEARDESLDGSSVAAAMALPDGRLVAVGSRTRERPGGGIAVRPIALLAPSSETEPPDSRLRACGRVSRT